MSPASPLSKQSMGEVVAGEIRKMIVDGSLRRGERVRREEIAQRLGVSPIPVREAIIALDREGWLRIEPHKGAYVLGIDVEYVHDHFDLLAEVWGLVAQHAAEEATPEQLERLAAAAVRSGRTDDASAIANGRFMQELLAIGGSPSVVAVLDLLAGIIPDGVSSDARGPASRARGIDEVMRALQARQPDDAGRAIGVLIRSHEASVIDGIARGGIPGDSSVAATKKSAERARRRAKSS